MSTRYSKEFQWIVVFISGVAFDQPTESQAKPLNKFRINIKINVKIDKRNKTNNSQLHFTYTFTIQTHTMIAIIYWKHLKSDNNTIEHNAPTQYNEIFDPNTHYGHSLASKKNKQKQTQEHSFRKYIMKIDWIDSLKCYSWESSAAAAAAASSSKGYHKIETHAHNNWHHNWKIFTLLHSSTLILIILNRIFSLKMQRRSHLFEWCRWTTVFFYGRHHPLAYFKLSTA